MSKPSPIRSKSDTAMLDIRPVAGRIGAEIRGIKLADVLDDATVAAIRAALLRHKVIFFRDQTDLDDRGHEAFAARLGEPAVHATLPTREGTRTILELNSKAGAYANSWHTDLTYLECPPAISVLRSLVVPETGGDTMWANMAAAYRDLPEPLRELADRLWTIHTSEYNHITSEENKIRVVTSYNKVTASSAGPYIKNLYEAEQPLVRVHPETGERSLLLGRYAVLIVNLRPEDAKYLLDMFQDYAIRPENTVRWSWRPNDVAIWDNRSTQHRMVADFGNERRVMRRVTLNGIQCRGIDGRCGRPIRIEALPAAAG